MSIKHRDEILERVKSAGVEYNYHIHEPVRTSAEASEVRGVALSSGAKALVLRGKKSGNSVLVVIPAHKKVNVKVVEKLVGEDLSFNPDVEKEFDCIPGSVPPFGSVLGLITYADLELEDVLNFNIGLLTDSLRLSKKDYLELEKPILGSFAI